MTDAPVVEMARPAAIASALRALERERSFAGCLAVTRALDASSAGERSGLAPIRVVILRTMTVEPLVPVLRADLALSGFDAALHIGDFDSIAAEVLGEGSAIYRSAPDLVILLQWLGSISPDLATRFPSLGVAQVTDAVEQVVATQRTLLSGIRERSAVPILVNNHPLPGQPTFGVLDAQRSDGERAATARLNQRLAADAASMRDVYTLDLAAAVERVGQRIAIDERGWYQSRAPFSRELLLEISVEIAAFARAIRGRARKCLVLDCDNTLWGGILGEDGPGGLALGATYPGSAFQAFQREILNLHDRGIVLSLCSKNDEGDVLRVLRDHDQMLIRERHLSAIRVNWQDKVTNLRSIATELNIGLDSLVYADDSPFECEFVRQALPDVAVIELGDQPSTYRRKLSECRLFDGLAFSEEDRRRTELYRAERERRVAREAASSLEEYLSSLQIEADIGRPAALELSRVAQLTQKTNQFNLTTVRYTLGEIESWMDRTDAEIVVLRLRDRLSDLGLVAAAIVAYEGDAADIKAFMMSCRAIGRGTEDALLAALAQRARSRGCRWLHGSYRPTAKNEMVRNFYLDRGFELIAEGDQAQVWRADLTTLAVGSPAWIHVPDGADARD